MTPIENIFLCQFRFQYLNSTPELIFQIQQLHYSNKFIDMRCIDEISSNKNTTKLHRKLANSQLPIQWQERQVFHVD